MNKTNNGTKSRKKTPTFIIDNKEKSELLRNLQLDYKSNQIKII
jgi:hypothetical protein